MRTALDTNILSGLLSRQPTTATIAAQLGRCKQEGPILVSPVVYAELFAYPNASESFLNHFLAKTSIQIDYRLDDAVWLETGRRFAQYATRRRQAMAEGTRRSLTLWSAHTP